MSGGTKHDSDKVRMELLPGDVLAEIARVFTFGAKKYSAWNWTGGFDWLRLYGAAQRHLNAWHGGEDTDPESGLPHLGHALCCLVMLSAHELRALGRDDRHKLGKVPPASKAAERGSWVCTAVGCYENTTQTNTMCERCARVDVPISSMGTHDPIKV